jgi:putative holliday junction resolvase
MRVLGLDVGSRTIGVAVTDGLGLSAHGVTTLARRGTVKDVETIRALVAEHEAVCVVVGLPFEGDGSEGHRAKRVRVLIDALIAAGLAVEECDERFTTVEAEEVLLEADLSRRKRKRVIDRLAAAVILERWLVEQKLRGAR